MLDVFNKEPGSYVTEDDVAVPTPVGVSVGTGAMMGVTLWGPHAPRFFTSFAAWVKVYGGYISSIYPSYKQVKKFFKNGGTRLWFKRIVHLADVGDIATKVSAASVGYIMDAIGSVAASIGAVTAHASNTSGISMTTSGNFTGLISGTYRLVVTTAGALGTAAVEKFFTPQDGSETSLGISTISAGVAVTLSNGVSVTFAAGTGPAVADESWSFPVTAAGSSEADRRIKVSGKFDGALGDRISVQVSAGSMGVAGEFALTVLLDGVQVEQKFDNLSTDVNADNYFLKAVNGVSDYITLEDTTNVQLVRVPQTVALTGGNNGLTGLVADDYAGDALGETGLQSFRTVLYDNLNISCPDSDAVGEVIVKKELCRFVTEDMPQCFALMSVPKGFTPEQARTYQNTTLAVDCCRSAIYYPHLIDEDDGEAIPGTGGMQGVYARFASSPTKGPWYSPAGIDASMRGFSGMERKIGGENPGILNENRINCFKSIEGAGIVCWGSRTMTITQTKFFKYIGARINTSDIETRLLKNTIWAPHQPNDKSLWEKITQTAVSILNKRYKAGGFDGESPKEAYAVVCDKSVNTTSTKKQGLVVCKVGMRNKDTAEFIWFSINQMTDGSSVEEA